MSEELLRKIKDAIDITFDDDGQDRKVYGFIEDGIVILRSLIGANDSDEIDWTLPGRERMLLKNYCLYAINNMTEDFENSYQKDIMAARMKYEVKHAKQK